MKKSELSNIIEEAFKEWRIREIRRDSSNISIDKFADYLDVSQSMVSYWISGARFPSGKSLIKLMPKLEELIGPSVYDRLGIKSPQSEADPILNEIREKYYTLPPERRAELLPLIEKFMEEHGFKKIDGE
jgi:transcriptional regulator with XRE-family HTH domain